MTIFIENKYTKWYYCIVQNDRAENRIKTKDSYFELHHIIPRSMNGDNSRENLILLTYREHFLCHWLLTKMCTKVQHTIKMQKALFKMTTSNDLQERRIASWQIVIAKRNAADAQRTRWNDSEYRQKQKQAVLTEEYKRVKSEKQKNNWKDSNYRQSVINTLTQTNLNPEVKKRRSTASKESQNRPDVIKKNSMGVKLYWQNAELREKHIANMRISANKPEVRKRNSEAQNRPEVINKKRTSLAITNKNEDVIKRRSLAAKKHRARPDIKLKTSEQTKLFNVENQKTCPHCGKICDLRNATRWHFDRCKNKGG
jgi:HNH endonuclease